jgi:hypothetical protein
MAKNTKKIARLLGAKVAGRMPQVGPGAFGAARMAALFQRRLQPQVGDRPGRPTDGTWTLRSKIPMSEETLDRLRELAKRFSTRDRKVSPMQVAAHLLEESVERIAQ